MYDIHNHVLPGVDDGSPGMRTSLHMLEEAILQGVTHVACTPHSCDRGGEESEKLFRAVFAKLKREVERIELPVQLGLAAEFMFGPELERTLTYSFATFNGKGEYFLLEFLPDTPFEIIRNVIRVSRKWGKRPVLAHFERFGQVCRSADRIKAVKDAGAVLTIDAGSLLGQFGKRVSTLTSRLVREGWIDILASDAHDIDKKSFCLKKGYEAAVKLIGEEQAGKTVLAHPKIVWDGSPWPYDKTAKRKSAS